MGSGAGKSIIPLVSLAAAPFTGGTSLIAGGSSIGTALGLASAGLSLAQRAGENRSDRAALASQLRDAQTERMLGELDVAERGVEAERQRAAQLSGIANSQNSSGRTKSALAGAANRESQLAFSSLAARQSALESRAQSRIAGLRRAAKQKRRDDTFGLIGDVRRFQPFLEDAFNSDSTVDR